MTDANNSNNNSQFPGTGWYIVSNNGNIGDGQLSFDDNFVVEKATKSEGCTCKKCDKFYPYAEPNQKDGTLICWACKNGY